MIALAWMGFCLVVSVAVVCVARRRRRGLQVRRRVVPLELRGVKWDSVVVDRREVSSEVSRRRAR